MTFDHKEITEAIIGSAFEVHNELGYGFLEKVYKNAMQVELIQARSQVSNRSTNQSPLQKSCRGRVLCGSLR